MLPSLYSNLAHWWPLLSPPSEYEEEAAVYAELFQSTARPAPKTLLEIGSGGGSNAFHLKQHFTLTLVDPSSGMRAVSQAVNPDCEHLPGDMRTLRLDRQFDCVFIHDAICYMTTEQDLQAAIETAAHHCRPGGAVILAPDHITETFEPGTDHGGHDDGARGLRYLEWTWDPDPADTTYTVDYAFLLRNADGSVTAEHDRHIEGLFPRQTWLDLIRNAGLIAGAPISGEGELFPSQKP